MDGTRTIDAPRTADVAPRVRSLHSVDSAAPPCVWVRHMSSALDFYLAADCTVLHAADGWVRLRNANASFVLAVGTEPLGSPRCSIPELTTVDLPGVCLRMRALGIHTGPGTGATLTVRDPDQYLVVITQAEAAEPGPVRRVQRTIT